MVVYIYVHTYYIILYTYKAKRNVVGGGGVGGGEGRKNVFIRMVECHAGLEIAPYISSAMRRETLFSTSQKPRTDVDHDEGVEVAGARETRAAVSLDFLIRTKLDVHMHTRSPPPSSLYRSNGGSSL